MQKCLVCHREKKERERGRKRTAWDKLAEYDSI